MPGSPQLTGEPEEGRAGWKGIPRRAERRQLQGSEWPRYVCPTERFGGARPEQRMWAAMVRKAALKQDDPELGVLLPQSDSLSLIWGAKKSHSGPQW